MASKTFYDCGCMEQGDQVFSCAQHRTDKPEAPPLTAGPVAPPPDQRESHFKHPWAVRLDRLVCDDSLEARFEWHEEARELVLEIEKSLGEAPRGAARPPQPSDAESEHAEADDIPAGDHGRMGAMHSTGDTVKALAARPPQPQNSRCINCFEANDGGYMSGFEGHVDEGNVGPFCSQCWGFLEEHFAMAARPPASPPALEALITKWREQSKAKRHIARDDIEDGIWTYQHEAMGASGAHAADADELEAALKALAVPPEAPPR